jgi:uncharacterized membrane protein YozB (DUF420 family)
MDKLTVRQIAQLLYRINFLPGLLAAVMIFYAAIFPGKFIGSLGIQSAGAIILFTTGTLCEGVYLVLYKYNRYTHKKALWVYTLVVNAFFIAYYIINVVVYQFSLTTTLIIYPIYFFVAGCMAIKKINKLPLIAEDGHLA